jgi:kynurenine formamidase
VLLSQNIPAFENLTNLDKLPSNGFEIIALPMKIQGGSGAPLRIIAMVPTNK